MRGKSPFCKLEASQATLLLFQFHLADACGVGTITSLGTSSAIRYSRLQCSQTSRAMMITLLMSPLRSQWRFVDGVDG